MVVFKTRSDRQVRALTGLPEEKINELETVFEEVYEEQSQKDYEEQQAKGERERSRGGGRKSKLPSTKHKLEFILYYLKSYPTMDELAEKFDMSRSSAHYWVHKLLPILSAALAKLGMLPKREFNTPEELKEALEEARKILIDATERKHRRPSEEEKQEELYSGKKKGHTVKNTIIATGRKVIIYVGRTFAGRRHDYGMFKEEFPPKQGWLKEEGKRANLDSGYQGINKDYGIGAAIPKKKPRKSKKNPNPELTEAEKERNKRLGKARIYVEHAIGGIKRFNILVHAFRNRKAGFADSVIAVCGGLWNFLIV